MIGSMFSFIIQVPKFNGLCSSPKKIMGQKFAVLRALSDNLRLWL